MFLQENKIHAKISKLTNIKMSHISTVLRELADKELLRCLNPQKDKEDYIK